MLPIFNTLRGLTLLSVCLRFLMATLCGAVIGYERGKARHAAGLRTHTVVCIGAASVMILSEFLFCRYGDADPARLGAQVISGIGFLGAGTIVITGHRQGQQIKGLTTAAGLWASACMGLMIGSGYYEAAGLMCLFLVMVIVAMNRIDERILKNSKVMRFYIEYDADVRFSAILDIVRKQNWHLTHLEHISADKHTVHAAIVDVQRNAIDPDREGLLSALRETPGVLFVIDA